MSDLPRYTIFYDANCRLCVRSRRTLERLGPRAELVFVDVRDDRAMKAHPRVDRDAGLRQMFVQGPSGELAGGYDAFLSLAPTVPLLRPLHRVLGVRAARMVGRTLYNWVARNRYRLGAAVSCETGACRL